MAKKLVSDIKKLAGEDGWVAMSDDLKKAIGSVPPPLEQKAIELINSEIKIKNGRIDLGEILENLGSVETLKETQQIQTPNPKPAGSSKTTNADKANPPNQPFWKRYAPNISMPKLPENWWMWLVGSVVAGIAILALGSGTVSLPTITGAKFNFPNAPAFVVQILFAPVILLAVNAIGFAEALNRHERWMLDWWIAPLTAIVLSQRVPLGHDTWLVMIGVVVTLFLVATFLNESEEQGNWFEVIDLTPLANIAGQLLILHAANWKLLPYPTYIPVWIVWVVFIISMIKELARSVGLGFFAIVTGVASAITLNSLVIALSLSVAVVGIHWAARKGWVPTTKHRSETQIFSGSGRELSLIVPWDVILGQAYVFAFTSFALYGNFVITTLNGGPK